MPKKKAKRSVPKIKTTQPLSSKVRLVIVLIFIITFLVFIIASGYWLFTFAKKVAIPTILGSGSTVQQTGSREVSPTPEITWETYTVRQGDNIRGIALQVYGDANAWEKIARANNLKNPDRIHAGNILRIPR